MSDSFIVVPKSKPIPIPPRKSKSTKKKKNRRRSRKQSKSVTFDEDAVVVAEPVLDSPPPRLDIEPELIDMPATLREHSCIVCKTLFRCLGRCECLKRSHIEIIDEWKVRANIGFLCSKKCKHTPLKTGWLW